MLGVMQLVCGIVVIIMGLGIVAVLFIRQMIKTIGASKAIIDELAANNLQISYDNKYEKRRDEIEDIYNDAYNFAESIKHIVQDIKVASTTLNEISSELREASQVTNLTTTDISKAMEDVAESATNQAGETQSVTLILFNRIHKN